MLSPLAISILRGNKPLRAKIGVLLGHKTRMTMIYLINKNFPNGTLCRPDILNMIIEETGLTMEQLYISQIKPEPANTENVQA